MLGKGLGACFPVCILVSNLHRRWEWLSTEVRDCSVRRTRDDFEMQNMKCFRWIENWWLPCEHNNFCCFYPNESFRMTDSDTKVVSDDWWSSSQSLIWRPPDWFSLLTWESRIPSATTSADLPEPKLLVFNPSKMSPKMKAVGTIPSNVL